jgi:gamma-glutamyltranspeptidase/glutathione hydrolase
VTSGQGTIAAGHPDTAQAAAVVLGEGGNAFDAALAAVLAAAVAEPVLTSLGGGGFLLARPADAPPRLFDFFVQTPCRRQPAEACEFFPIVADFGPATQEFHIGIGATATPGTVAGVFAVHRALGRMPLARIAEPALALARDGVRVNRLQAYIFSVVQAIYLSQAPSRALYGSRTTPDSLLTEGETFTLPDYAAALDALVHEGEALFYRGDIAARILDLSAERGGHLGADDLADYQVIMREPLAVDFAGARLFTNPPPSTGGILIGFALALLRDAELAGMGFGSAAYLATLARAMQLTNKARVDSGLAAANLDSDLLDAGFVARYRAEVLGQPATARGTTHISVIDSAGNAAGVSLSNGEGCGHVIPGTGVMLNNVLGEEDLNPGGFHRWATDQRMASMMAPTLVLWPDGGEAVMGSGGSNRIRTAILQVILDLVALGMDVRNAVEAPRIHHEGDVLHLEDGFAPAAIAELAEAFPNQKPWGERNLFFGGVHCATKRDGGFAGAGDPRRGGVALRLDG